MTVPFLLKHLTLIGFHHFFLNDDEKLSSAFFSLHTSSMEPLYVSETVHTRLLLSFGKVILPHLPQRTYHVVLKLWQKIDGLDSWTLYYDVVVDLRRLLRLRKPFRERDDGLRDKSTVWCFEDHEYVLPGSVKDQSVVMEESQRRVSTARKNPKKSYTVDDIRHLISLDTGIKELELLNLKLSQQIDDVLEEVKGKVSKTDPEKARGLKFRLHQLHRYTTKQRNKNDTVNSWVYEKKVLIGNLNRALDEHFPPFRDLCEYQLEYVTSQINPIHESLNAAIYPEIIQSLESIGGVIIETFCIKMTSTSEQLSIMGIDFPRSTKELLEKCYAPHSGQDAPESPSSVDKMNAGLSYIVALMLLLADILSVLLTYAVRYFGSRSMVFDHLSGYQDIHGLHVNRKVTYPLYFDARHLVKTAALDSSGRTTQLKNLKFELGLALLNKNLTALTTAATNLFLQLHQHEQINVAVPSDRADDLLWSLRHLLSLMTIHSPGGTNT